MRLGWVRSPQSIEVRFGTSRAGAVDVALYTTASVDAIPATTRGRPEGRAVSRQLGGTAADAGGDCAGVDGQPEGDLLQVSFGERLRARPGKDGRH
ncbi:hypothetical protein [Streptomyces sp. NPDC002343]